MARWQVLFAVPFGIFPVGSIIFHLREALRGMVYHFA